MRLFDKNFIFNKCCWKWPQSGKTAYMFLISCVNKKPDCCDVHVHAECFIFSWASDCMHASESCTAMSFVF